MNALVFAACLAICLGSAWWTLQGLPAREPRRMALVSKRLDGDEWMNEGGSEGPDDPDAWKGDSDETGHLDASTGPPGYYLAPTASRYRNLGKRIECPMCAAVNQERAKAKLEPIRQHFRIRNRDGAIYCARHDQATYPMSEDTVMRYDPRYHREQDSQTTEAE